MMKEVDAFLYKYLGRVVDITSMCILVFLVVVVFINICFRYLFNLPIAWSDELAKILLVWLTFIGGAAASRRGRHLKIEDLLKKMVDRKKSFFHRLINIVVALFLIIFIWKGFSMAYEVRNQVTDALQISNTIYYIPLPLGGIIMLPYNIRNIFYGGERGKKI